MVSGMAGMDVYVSEGDVRRYVAETLRRDKRSDWDIDAILATSSRNGPTWSARILIWWTCPDRITSQGGGIGRSSPKAATGISSRATECVDWLSSWPPCATNWETCEVA